MMTASCFRIPGLLLFSGFFQRLLLALRGKCCPGSVLVCLDGVARLFFLPSLVFFITIYGFHPACPALRRSDYPLALSFQSSVFSV
jgi:hypothetical protein